MSLVDNRDLVGPLDDLHRIAAGSEHRTRHAGSEAEAARRVAGPLDQRLIVSDFPLCFGCHRQIRLGAASTAGASEAFVYFVQAGAYARTDEAEAQRAKLAIQGFESRITEREQSGRTVYRVRVGPFNQKADAEQVKATLAGAGTESALVRVQK